MGQDAAPRFDLNLLRVFLAVYDAKSVGGAAQALNMSQPGLSTALARLRRQLGDPLFLRGATGMEPTSRARSLADSVRGIMRAVDAEVLKPPVFDPTTSTREFRIALTDIAEGIYLPIALRALKESASRMSLRSVFMSPRELEEAMAAGEVDMAATVGRGQRQQPDQVPGIDGGTENDQRDPGANQLEADLGAGPPGPGQGRDQAQGHQQAGVAVAQRGCEQGVDRVVEFPGSGEDQERAEQVG